MKLDSGQSTRDKRKHELGASQNLLLGVLAALIALLGYLYFFTDLIKQRDIQQKPPTGTAQTVKQPIPPRPAGDVAKPAAAVPQQDMKPQASPVPAAPAKPQPSATPPATPQPAAAQKPSVPAPPPAIPAAKTASVEQPKVSQQPSPKPDPKQVKQAVAPPVKPVEKIAQPDKNLQKPAETKPAKATTSSQGRYRITTAGILSSTKADSVLSEMKKAGFEKIEKKQRKEEKSMKRLFAGEFGDSASAANELEKLRKVAPGAFLLNESGKHTLYAGSYDQQTRAESEVKRLTAQGLNVSIRKAELKMPATSLSALIADKATANSFVKRLKALGVASEIRQVEK